MSRMTENEFSSHVITFSGIYASNKEVDLLLELGNRGPPWGNGRLRSLPVSPWGHNGDSALREREAHRAQSLDPHWSTRAQEIERSERHTLLQEGRRGPSKTTWTSKALGPCVDCRSPPGRSLEKDRCCMCCLLEWVEERPCNTNLPLWNSCGILKPMSKARKALSTRVFLVGWVT